MYGVTNDEDLVLCDRLDDYASHIANFSYRTCVASAESAHDRKGYVTEHIETDWLNNGDLDVYLCGPVAMVDAVTARLQRLGLKPANFFYEKFTPAAVAASTAIA